MFVLYDLQINWLSETFYIVKRRTSLNFVNKNYYCLVYMKEKDLCIGKLTNLVLVFFFFCFPLLLSFSLSIYVYISALFLVVALVWLYRQIDCDRCWGFFSPFLLRFSLSLSLILTCYYSLLLVAPFIPALYHTAWIKLSFGVTLLQLDHLVFP
jgi:hypothetical protein